MKIKDVMTQEVACCTPQSNLQEVARLMRDHDCGAVPVSEGNDSRRLVGIVTDRDIVIRAVADGQNPLDLTAADVMSEHPATCSPEDDLDDCCKIMERRQVRRIPIVDRSKACCGIVSQADIALNAPEHETAEVVQEVSKPGHVGAQA